MFLVLMGVSTVIVAEDDLSSPRFENEFLSMRLRPNTPEQMAAFYEARGFPKAALEALKATCFITVMIRNESDRVIWLEPARWRFLAKRDAVKRLDRDYWEDQWHSIGLPQRHRATFGWTQLPELRDLRPQEPVGGNVVLAWTNEPFSLEARLATGPDKQGDEITVRFEDIRCAGKVAR